MNTRLLLGFKYLFVLEQVVKLEKQIDLHLIAMVKGVGLGVRLVSAKLTLI